MKTSCTLFHWDMPQALYDEYKSFLSNKVVGDFRNYTRTVFNRLGDKCDYWITFNEPKTTCSGFGPNPGMAPGVKGPRKDIYTCGHNLLLSHAAIVEEYRKTGLKAPIGIKIDVSPGIPYVNDNVHNTANDRFNDFEIGWFVRPLTKGDYPSAMKSLGSELPTFTSHQSKSLKGSVYFIGMDAYTTTWTVPSTNCAQGSENYPRCVDDFKVDKNGKTVGIPTGSSWNYLNADASVYGGAKLLTERYGTTVPLWISETGMSVIGEVSLPIAQRINDTSRIQWYRETLKAVKKSIDKGYNIKGFVPWSCMDNFEWAKGYTERFGLIGIEYDKTGKGSQKRFPKNSGAYLKSVFAKGNPI
eukprot:TRINITY_DN376_c0_g2_i1.p2 TRINITY_DN376_c0_g2~~TRINITY_DN376_c0_g2_i1.p2  ORF type:complete len:357 (-),score=88.74 TRINITY_DN376_c0_g2_i1:36-1106(-)